MSIKSAHVRCGKGTGARGLRDRSRPSGENLAKARQVVRSGTQGLCRVQCWAMCDRGIRLRSS